LAPALGLLVQIELALDAVDLAIEQIDERPKKIGQVVLEPGVGEHGAQGVNHGVEMGLRGLRLGQRTRIGLVAAEAMAVPCDLIEQMRGR